MLTDFSDEASDKARISHAGLLGDLDRREQAGASAYFRDEFVISEGSK